LNVYTLDLGATEAQQATVALVVMMPATYKILFGFLSDNYPIFGYQQKPYMIMGWLGVVASMIILLYVSGADFSMEYDPLLGASNPPLDAPSVQGLSAAFFFFVIGLWLADVMGDSIVVRACWRVATRIEADL
jgi:MFS family permease